MLKTKHITLFLALFLTVGFCLAQEEETTVKGKVVNSADSNPLENVNIVNINQVRGTATNANGEFEIRAKANDTLHLSYLGFKSIRVRVTNDWVKFKNTTIIELTELALALEEVKISQIKLTGVLKSWQRIWSTLSSLPGGGQVQAKLFCSHLHVQVSACLQILKTEGISLKRS